MLPGTAIRGAAVALAMVCLALGWAKDTQAVPITMLAMKLSDSTPATNDLDAHLGWTNAGGFNEGNAVAQLLVDNGLDYKNSIVDTEWDSVLSVRVAMYRSGLEQAFIQFDPGTSKTDFFAPANVTASTYSLSDLNEAHNFFSIAGDAGIDRHWFINQSYPGCPADVGNWVVLDRRARLNYICPWEENRVDDVGSTERGFLYAIGSEEQNWTTGAIGAADVYAVFVTMDVAQVAEPGSLGLLAIGAFALAAVRRRKRS